MRPPAWIPVLAMLALAATAVGQDVQWSTLDDQERGVVMSYLESPHWPFRAHGVLRLERYAGPQVEGMVRERLADEAWQVRCFAIRLAGKMKLDIPADTLAAEPHPHVVRAGLRSGYAFPADNLSRGVGKLLETRKLDELMLGIELAAASDIDELRTNAAVRVRRLIANMDDGVAALVSRRLAIALRVAPMPRTADDWREWASSNGGRIELPDRDVYRRRLELEPLPLVAEMELETLIRLNDYLGLLRQQDLDVVIAMDTTASMIPMVNEARAGVDGVILFLNDIARSMRLGFVAYRDHDNPPVWEGQRFTQDVEAIREFLFAVKITGGADLPEAVLDGLAACSKLDWRPEANRQVILVGDAEPHPDDGYALRELLDGFRTKQIAVHTVHIPMRRDPELERRMDPTRVAEDRRYIAQHNERTADAFAEIARLGQGRSASIVQSDELVPAVMHFTIDEAWWPVFDEFYAKYLSLCR